LKELDHGVEIVAVNGTRAPGSHVSYRKRP
jgi:hypothetical protein